MMKQIFTIMVGLLALVASAQPTTVPAVTGDAVVPVFTQEGNAPGFFFDPWESNIWSACVGGYETLAGGERVYKIENFTWHGDQWSPIDATNKKYFHLDVYPMQDMTLSLAPIDNSKGEQARQEFSLTANEWNGINVDMQIFPMDKFFQVKFVGANGQNGPGTETFYVGNMYLHTDVITDTEAPVMVTAEAVEVGGNSVTLKLNATDNNSKVTFVIADGNNGKTYEAVGTAGEDLLYTIEGLMGETEYTFVVSVKDVAGNVSENRLTVNFTTIAGFKLTAAPAPTRDAANVISVYSDAYTPAVTFGWGGWGQSTQAIAETVDGDNLYHLNNFNYLGFDSFSTDLDLSEMQYLHIDVLPMQEMTFGITPILRNPTGGAGLENSQNVGALTVKEWNSIDLPLSQFNIDFANKCFQVKIDRGNGANELYFDNLYFYKEGGEVEPDPEPSKDLYVFGIEGATDEKGVLMDYNGTESYNLDIVVTEGPVRFASTEAYSEETAVGQAGEDVYTMEAADFNQQQKIVDGGKGFDLAPGKYHITAARWFDARDFAIFAIQDVRFTGVAIAGEDGNAVTALELEAGETAQLTAAYAPEYAIGEKTIEWSSDNEDVVTVSETGLVTAQTAPATIIIRRAAGDATAPTATVKATAKSNAFAETVEAEVTVMVNAATGINDMELANKVAGVKYVNVMGQVSDSAFDGVNIVVTTYGDGSQKTTKVIF